MALNRKAVHWNIFYLIYPILRISMSMNKPRKSRRAGRSAITGRFVKIVVATKRPKSHVVELVPLSGYGTSR